MCRTNLICAFSDLYILTFIRDVQELNPLLKFSSWLPWKGLWVLVKGLSKGSLFLYQCEFISFWGPPLNANKIKQDAEVMHAYAIASLCFHTRRREPSEHVHICVLRNQCCLRIFRFSAASFLSYLFWEVWRQCKATFQTKVEQKCSMMQAH